MSLQTTQMFTGRFFRLEQPLAPGGSLVEEARIYAWNRQASHGQRQYRGWCTPWHPHNGDLESDADHLAYEDDDGGIYRLWIREDERKPGKVTVTDRAAEIAGERFDLLPRSSQRDFENQAKKALLEEMPPRVRVIPVLAWGNRAWIGRRGAFEDRAYASLLRTVVGDLQPDPMVWELDKSPGWHALSLATLEQYVETKTTELDADVSLLGIGFKGQEICCSSGRITEEHYAILCQFLELSPKPEIVRLQFAVEEPGERTLVMVDTRGIFRIDPPRSSGGLPSERLKRRLGAAVKASERLGELMKGFFDLMTGV